MASKCRNVFDRVNNQETTARVQSREENHGMIEILPQEETIKAVQYCETGGGKLLRGEKFEAHFAAYLVSKRSPGEGVLSLVKDVVEVTPLADMKHLYRYKLDTNPRFKDFMDQLVSGKARLFLSSLAGSKPLEDTKRDLVQMGIPVDEIVKYLADHFTVFFDTE
ncbi:hypothetical protein AAG570_000750 [Ranatra chinensis]|uniref:Uncharacterized protein n=1 Tax=Ranatra chinensis TaxID=642074 RepID=A0ABD0YY09_9HEMI